MIQLTTRLRIVGILSSVLAATAFANADLISNGSFENGSFSPNTGDSGTMKLPNLSTAITGWQVMNQSGGDITWESNANPWGLKASNLDKFIDLTGYDNDSTFPKGGIQLVQTVPTEAGHLYKLTFDVGSSKAYDTLNPVVQVSVNGTPGSYTFTGNVNLNDDSPAKNHWQTANFTFTAQGPTILAFTAWTPGTDRVILLDNVTLSAVPEPATVLAGALLLLPLGVSSLRIVRRKSVG
jgi:hypothetical protein